MGKAGAAKKVGTFVLAKKVVGKILKLAMIAGAGAAVVKVLKGDDR